MLIHLHAALVETSDVRAHDGRVLVRGHPSPRRRRIVCDDLCIQQLSLDVADGYARGVVEGAKSVKERSRDV